MKYKFIIVLSGLLAALGLQAQLTTSLKINEILVINDDNFLDDYGNKNPWIEIYNNSPGTVNIAGCYLTDDIKIPKKYMVPKGDVLTKISPRQHILFWADSKPARGTFHLNFTLNPDSPNFIALFDSDGATLIDSVTVPAGQIPDVSYGLVEDGWAQKDLEQEMRLNPSYKGGNQLWIYFNENEGRFVTPSSNNKILDTNVKIENFKENDSIGAGMTLTAMGVVFSGLLMLFLIFKLIGNTAVVLSHRRAMKASGMTREEAKDITRQSGDIFAAIAMAIYEATELHDEENTILTIKNTARNYSPWSSKIYTLREMPRK
ncbi:MAG: lamin tail domain-containing protein [Dysgonamonadaceae bacterium]|jgi:Na+-transporting methylmalonyl-CoA/oxaloacetate decarboxylase gamma subunit|nr:lamin tail domain-containing protein [Dysgonamonadaceae bacterium]